MHFHSSSLTHLNIFVLKLIGRLHFADLSVPKRRHLQSLFLTLATEPNPRKDDGLHQSADRFLHLFKNQLRLRNGLQDFVRVGLY